MVSSGKHSGEGDIIKINLLDPAAVKRVLDDELPKILLGKYGLGADHSYEYGRIALGSVAVAFGAGAQFYPVPMLEARLTISILVAMYFVFSMLMSAHAKWVVPKDHVLSTKAAKGFPPMSVCATLAPGYPHYTVTVLVDGATSNSKQLYATEFFTEKGFFVRENYVKAVSKVLDPIKTKKSQ